MRVAELLHFACRARDPEKLGLFYAELFEGRFLLHPVMSGLGIVLVKLNHPEALFQGLLEFWPWDIVWDGPAQRFRRIQPEPSPTSYGHVALKIDLPEAEVVAQLQRRGIAHRLEPRGAGVLIPTLDDPEGNLIELFPRFDHMELPASALVPASEGLQAIAALKARFLAAAARQPGVDGFPLDFPS